ncbi:MAG: SAM-dependent methyltransferase [Cyanobium sp. M30B3]|nr:MAG: SAM-dependent methyltransferase [Cyanobium sp. M30B3]
MPPAPPAEAAFTARVRERFGRRARGYRQHAPLQRAVAWRLAHLLARQLAEQGALPAGPAADLGAGSGLLGEALHDHGLPGPLLQLDLCPELLAANPLARRQGPCLWDLNAGLPAQLRGAGLLCSSFALQWLEQPAAQLELWCGHLAPGGWLALALPTAGSFPQWHRAAARAGVPFSGLALPDHGPLLAVAERQLELRHRQLLRFSPSQGDGRRFLGSLRAIGAVGSRGPRLGTAELRRLLQHWPSGEGITWRVLLLIGRRRS